MTTAARIPLDTPAPTEPPARFAAIDIGSNSIRQIIADVTSSGQIRIVDEMKAAPRLGQGLQATGKLDESAIDLALASLTRMATLAKQFGAERVDAVATSAVRDASNGRAFIARARRETGLKIRLLAGEDEARLSFRSALAHFDLASGRTVVMDIGGGSLELALSAEGLVERLISLPFGAIRVTEEYLGERPRRRHVRELRERVRAEIKLHLPVRDWRGARLIGSGGTFTNLGAMFLARRGLPWDGKVHATVVPREDLEHIFEMLLDTDPHDRAAIPGLNPARADIILGGLIVASEVADRLESRALVVSGYGIREGLLLESARVTPVAADPGVARERSVRTFAERCHYEEPHARHVQTIALQLFDAIGERLGCERRDRLTLADAALLHDVGYHINYKKHHKHSYHLIRHADLLGVPPDEQVAIAHVARYHRGAMPKRTHEEYATLDSSLRQRIKRLASIMRVADGFDRGHVGAVERVKVRWLDRAIRITAQPRPGARSLRLELWGAMRKSGLLAKVTGLPVEIVGPDGQVVAEDDDSA